ncbi:MAG TPA: choice-of-anchor P family protein [Verrucomicrobiae bacterium]|nr:choice-of-anchor P family protein [Verrucomicrobiae bacterium]
MKAKNILITVLLATAVLAGGSHAALGTPKKPAKKAKPVAKHKGPKPKPQKPRPTHYSGRATAVNLTNNLGVAWLLADTGPLPACGGLIDITIGPTNLDSSLSIGGAHVTASGIAGVSSSIAEVQSFSATFIQDGITNVIAFAYAAAEARAECGSNGLALSASSEVQGLTIDGVPVTVTGEANQVLSLASGNIVLNAQLTSTNGAKGEITVAAIFVMLTNGFQGTIAYAEADIRCGSRVVLACDKITGGGFIETGIVDTNGLAGAHGSFGVSAGIKRGEFVGRLNYIDHGTGMHVTSTGVTGFTAIDLVTRAVDFNVLIDGVPGTARVVLADNGEPGRNDIFDIALSTGYQVAGTLRGGNIQLHKCPPGWAKSR